MSVHEAYEHVGGNASAPVLLTCEHASDRLPAPWRWPTHDDRLRGTHWAFDLGAADIVRELSAALGCAAVLSRFTRLLADPNRPLDHPDLFRPIADGQSVALNTAVDAADRDARVRGYYEPFHAAVDRAVRAHEAPLLLSIHSFTPEYEGARRDLELGILFNDDEVLAQRWFEHLSNHMPRVELNQPWSGKEGLIYSVERHARCHGRRALELEVRQDLAQDPAYRARLVDVVVGLITGS